MTTVLLAEPTPVGSPAPTGCTVGPTAVGRHRCGKPVVVTFTARGLQYGECLDHAPAFALREQGVASAEEPAIRVGATVRVTHGGITKTGTVTEVGRLLARIEVPVVRTGGTKTITRRLDEIKAIGR